MQKGPEEKSSGGNTAKRQYAETSQRDWKTKIQSMPGSLSNSAVGSESECSIVSCQWATGGEGEGLKVGLGHRSTIEPFLASVIFTSIIWQAETPGGKGGTRPTPRYTV